MSIGEFILAGFCIIIVCWLQMINRKLNRIQRLLFEVKFTRRGE